MQRWHFIEGEAGCRFAVERGCAAIVVDALRASATAAMMLEAGAAELLVCREVEEARALKAEDPDVLLFGERGGLPPEGFDGGNSPREVGACKGRTVIFTTTTGAGRLVACWGAAAVLLGTAVNAAACVRAAMACANDVVMIPAGLMHDPYFDAQEDRAAAAYLASLALDQGAMLGEGTAACQGWIERIQAEGLEALFDSAPHAEKLRKAGLEADVSLCARTDLTAAVPCAAERVGAAVRCVQWRGHE